MISGLILGMVGRATRIHVTAQKEASLFLAARTGMEDKTLFLLQCVTVLRIVTVNEKIYKQANHDEI